MPRKLDEILTEAVKLINPRKDNVEAFRAQLKVRIDTACRVHQVTAKTPPLGQMKKRAVAYLDLLQRVRKAALQQRQWTHPKASDDFTAALDQEINRVDATAWGLDVPIDELGRAQGQSAEERGCRRGTDHGTRPHRSKPIYRMPLAPACGEDEGRGVAQAGDPDLRKRYR
jgi:hypothetical protein